MAFVNTIRDASKDKQRQIPVSKYRVPSEEVGNDRAMIYRLRKAHPDLNLGGGRWLHGAECFIYQNGQCNCDVVLKLRVGNIEKVFYHEFGSAVYG